VGAVREFGFFSGEYGAEVGLFDLGNLNPLICHHYDILGPGRAKAADYSQQQDEAAGFAHASHDTRPEARS
jgi:hypothetical protein